MKDNTFSIKSKDYLQNNMSICLIDLNKKITTDAPNKWSFFNDLIEFMIILKPPYKYGEPEDPNNNTNDQYLIQELSIFLKQYNIQKGSKEFFIFDLLQRVFLHYHKGGIYLMYKHKENESWYPKIIIKENMGTRKYIDALDKNVTIYRGTSKVEYKLKKFGQAWTIDKKVANKFAFKHYLGQPDHQGTKRVVLKTQINRTNIFYFDKDDDEQEVVIDIKALIIDSIDICKEKYLD